MIFRQDYIKAITPFIDKKIIKILTGVRRCGKSTIFEMIKEELIKRKVPEKNIITKNYTDINFDKSFTDKDMFNDIKKAITTKEKYYLLLDELQEINGWEKVVNNLLEKENADIYVTGSNSKLMSGEISTYLSGRYISIPVYTLSFKEFLNFRKQDNLSVKDSFEKYIKLGGFPLIALENFEQQSAYQIVSDIYNSVITRDISRRHQIKKQDLFDRVVKFVLENMGKTFSANSILNFLKNEFRTISIETIYNYLKWLEDAFIIYKCQRYDLQGKAVLKTQEKYYLADVSLKYSIMGYNGKMVSASLENIVYLELKRRGYSVYIGKNLTKEIDFVAQKRDEKIYVQVCDKMPKQSDREINNLLEIKDNYPKYIVTLDNLAVGNENGIKTTYITDFLLQENF